MDRHVTEFNLRQESLSSDFLLQPRFQDAYEVCLMYESQLAAEDDRRWIRILGYLLLYAHKEGARIYLANTIMYIKDEPGLLVKLGQLIEQHVILPCEFSLFSSW